MQRRAWYASILTVLFLAVTLAPVPTVAAHHDDVDRYDKHLRSFGGMQVIRQNFALDLDEEYTRYFWTLTPGRPVVHDEVDHMAYAYIEVQRVAGGEIMCRGAVYSNGHSGVDRSCDDLRVGHTYQVTIVTTHANAKMDLWGYEPDVWPPPGGANLFGYLPL